MKINAHNMYYRDLNKMVRKAIKKGEKEIVLDNVCGQYYIGDGLTRKDVKIIINGVPGNDMGAFMNGPIIIVNDDAQDAIGNTMNGGKIVVYGNVGDVLGYSMRGGVIYVKGNAGYRTCIHMKEYKGMHPTVVIGGCTGAFAGEYMAGGTLIILGIDCNPLTGYYLGTGIHGGRIFLRGQIDKKLLSRDVKTVEPDMKDKRAIENQVREFCKLFNYECDDIMKPGFVKIVPASKRPYAHLYISGP